MFSMPIGRFRLLFTTNPVDATKTGFHTDTVLDVETNSTYNAIQKHMMASGKSMVHVLSFTNGVDTLSVEVGASPYCATIILFTFRLTRGTETILAFRCYDNGPDAKYVDNPDLRWEQKEYDDIFSKEIEVTHTLTNLPLDRQKALLVELRGLCEKGE